MKSIVHEAGNIYLTMLNSLTTSLALIDGQGEILYVNKAWRDFAEHNGITPDKVSEGVNYLRVCDAAAGPNADEAPLFAAGIRCVLYEDSPSFSLEYPCHSPSKRQWFQDIVSPITLEDARCAMILHVDITSRIETETRLRASEEKHRLLFESMPLGVVYQDAKGAITSANPAAERILGLTLEQMQGRTSTDPRWKAVHEDGSDFSGETHPSMIALKTGQSVRDVVIGGGLPFKR